MSERSKRYEAVRAQVDRTRLYPTGEAIQLLKACATAKFDEMAAAAFRLNVDPKKNEHRIRSTVILPHGTGKSVRVLAFAKGDKLNEAKAAGADYAGGEDYVKQIEAGWFEFDAVVATPDIMNVVSKLGKILGPRGLMPSPKTGTVTPDIARAVQELKRGKLEFRSDEYGNVHSPFGKRSFGQDQLRENFLALAQAIFEEKPEDIKGKFVKSVTISTTMSPGIKVDPDELGRLVAAQKL
jgi:large subunit ribosomal protein L1